MQEAPKFISAHIVTCDHPCGTPQSPKGFERDFSILDTRLQDLNVEVSGGLAAVCLHMDCPKTEEQIFFPCAAKSQAAGTTISERE